jgi:cell division septum initiation protein DivIVA
MKKPKVNQPSKAKADLKELEKAMNGGTIPKRKSGEEVQAATESGARVAIKSGGESGGKLKQAEATALIPPLDGVGKAANAMADCIVACDTAAEEKGKAESKLIAALRKAKRTSIKVKGINLLLSHIGPKDKITAQKPK